MTPLRFLLAALVLAAVLCCAGLNPGPALLVAAFVVWPLASTWAVIRILQHRKLPHRIESLWDVALQMVRRLLPIRHSHVLHHGRHYVVNEWWHDLFTKPWPHLARWTHQEISDEGDRLLLKSHKKRLSEAELTYLDAINKHFDLRTCIKKLNGRSIDEFGFTGHDQLHFKEVPPEPCGCVREVVYCNHGTDPKHHHHAVPGPCRKHEPHVESGAHPLDVHARIRADNAAVAASTSGA